MKILYITLENLSLQKGSVVHVKEIVAGLRRRGHEVGLMGLAAENFDQAEHFYNVAFFPPSLPTILISQEASSFPFALVSLLLPV